MIWGFLSMPLRQTRRNVSAYWVCTGCPGIGGSQSLQHEAPILVLWPDSCKSKGKKARIQEFVCRHTISLIFFFFSLLFQSGTPTNSLNPMLSRSEGLSDRCKLHGIFPEYFFSKINKCACLPSELTATSEVQQNVSSWYLCPLLPISSVHALSYQLLLLPSLQ